VVCAIALIGLRWDDVKSHSFLFAIAFAILLVPVIHLIPLPPSIWQHLPGRDLVVEIDKITNLQNQWRPISLVPTETWNAFYALFIPLAVFLLAVQLDAKHRFKLLPLLITIGLVSGLWGIIQIIGNPHGPAYLYRTTNSGSAVGLFANRNHQAVFLAMLFPMLSLYASTGIKGEAQMKFQTGVALSIGALLIPLTLITGSRAGLAAGIIGMLCAALLYRKPKLNTPVKRKVQKFKWQYAVGAFVVLCLTALTVLMSQAQALQRLAQSDQSEELRFKTWGLIASKAWEYFPAGSGIGSFVEVYKIFEPAALLRSSYFNHAHNDWLELYLTGGLLALVVLIIIIVAFTRCVKLSLSEKLTSGRRVAFSRLGAVVILIFALASLVDYPLRVPSLACVLVIAALWLGDITKPARQTVSSF
tara:strand:- start:38116 stop:39366 length:1251 start_codon:yes stop_codon:yes gene_type:complete